MADEALTLDNGDETNFDAWVDDVGADGKAAYIKIADGTEGGQTRAAVTARGLKVEVDGLAEAVELGDNMAAPTTSPVIAHLAATDASNTQDRLKATVVAGALDVGIAGGNVGITGTVTVQEDNPVEVTNPAGETLAVSGTLQLGPSAYAAADDVGSTLLDNLAADGATAATAAIDNSTDRWAYADLELVLGDFATAPSAGGTIDVYILPSLDGTNYATVDGNGVPPAHALLTQLSATDQDNQRLIALDLPVPPTLFKLVVVNGLDQPFPSTANELKVYRHA